MRNIISESNIKYFLDWAKDFLKEEISFEKESHGDEGVVYKINTKQNSYFLKIKNDSIFEKERERLAWLKDKIPVPIVLGFTERDGTGAMLLTALEGKNLAVLSKEWEPNKLIDKLVGALHKFHNINTQGWPFDESDPEKILVHGDACLPNFIFNGDSFSGYIDLADCKLAEREVDLSATVWSLQYNLGSGHGAYFLKKYGYEDTTEEIVEKLRNQYESYQKAQGFL